MRIALNESERREILSLYNETKTNHQSILKHESDRIKKLMNLTESINPSKFFDEVPALKGLSKTMGEYSTTVDDFVRSLGNYSQKLKNAGIDSIDTLLTKAREFQEANKSKFGSLVDDGLVIQRYLIETGALREIEDSLITKNLDAIENKTFDAFQEMTTELGRLGRSLDDVNNIQNSIPLTNKDLPSLQGTSAKLEDASTKLDETIQKIEAELTEIPSSQNRNLAQDQLSIKLNKIKKELNKFKLALTKQKNSVDGVIEQLEQRARLETSAKITYLDKVYDAATLTSAQRLLLWASVDKLPSFVTLVLRFLIKLSTYRKVELLQTELIRNIAKLKEIEIQFRTYNTRKIPNEYNEYLRETATLIENIKGKVLDYTNVKEGNLYNYFVQVVKGSTGFSKIQKTELDDIWREITSILQYEVDQKKLTQSEMTKILENIKKVYSKTDASGNIVGPDSGLLGGALVFREDLQTIAKSIDIKELKTALEKSGAPAVEYATKETDVSSVLNKFIDDKFKLLTGFSTKEFFGNFTKGFVKVSIRESLFGLPFNLRQYLTPMARTGFNIKGAGQTYLNFMIAQAVGTIVIGGINACIEFALLSLTMGYTGLSRDEVWDMSITEWQRETSKYKDLDLTEILGDIINSEYDQDTEVNKVSGLEYYSDVKREYGPLKIKVWESFVEIGSILKAKPTQEEYETYVKRKAEEQKNNTNKKTLKKIEQYQDLYYSFTPEEQRKQSGDNWMYDSFSKGETSKLPSSLGKKIQERFFMKMEDYNGFTSLNDINATADQIKTSYGELNSYTGYPCVCKKPLSKQVDYVKLPNSDEKVTVEIPICNDFVRLVKYSTGNVGDYKPTPGVDGQLGFTLKQTPGTISTKDWLPINQIGNYVK